VLPGIVIPYVSLFPLWLFYFVFGMYGAQRKEHWQQRLAGRETALGLMWLFSLAVLVMDSRYTETHASSIKPSVMLYCLTSFFFFYSLALRGKDTVRRWGIWLDWMSTHSFLIFLLHPLLLNLLAIYVPAWPPLAGLWSGTQGMILLYLVTTACTIMLTHLLSLIPYSVWIGGVYAGRRKPKTVTASG
jgi:membrane-bound acyltransferase YfiQ involved in biofilm formation